MKKKCLVVVMVLFAVAFCMPSFAAEGDQVGTPTIERIGYVDLARALNEVNEGKTAKSSLEKEFKAKKSELDGMKDKIGKIREELEKKSQLLSQEALAGKRDEYQRMFVEYQQKAKDYTEQLAMKEGEMTNKIIGKLRTVVEKIAQKDGYTFVFEKSQGALVYGPSNADLTSQVIKQYNK